MPRCRWNTPCIVHGVSSLRTRAGRAISIALAAVLGGACAVDEVGEGEEELAASNPSAATSVSMPACGVALANFDGVAAYSNAASSGTGVSCKGLISTGYGYQCVELAMRYFKTKHGFSWRGNASALLANAPRDKVDVFMNGDSAHPPVPGDLIVWPNNTYGHVAVVTAVSGNRIEIIEQNVRGNGRATLTYSGGRIGARWGNWVPTGWAHAKANTRPPSGGAGGPGGGTGQDAGSTLPEPATRGSSVVRIELPTVLPEGTSAPIAIRLKNSGTVTWSAARRFRLAVVSPNEATWAFDDVASADPDSKGKGGYFRDAGDGRVFLPADVAPGATVTLRARVSAPASRANGDRVKLAFQMIEEGVSTFGSRTTREIDVCTPGAEGCIAAPPTSDAGVVEEIEEDGGGLDAPSRSPSEDTETVPSPRASSDDDLDEDLSPQQSSCAVGRSGPRAARDVIVAVGLGLVLASAALRRRRRSPGGGVSGSTATSKGRA